MHCPNCGTRTASEQKFCRACGMALDKVAQILSEQTPEVLADAGIRRRKQRVEQLLALLIGGIISTVVVAILWGIIFKVMIEKGEMLKGGIFLTVIVGGLLAVALLLYRESLIEREAKSAQPAAQPQLPRAQPTKGLPEPPLEPVPSVTERTTELLAAERRRDTREV